MTRRRLVVATANRGKLAEIERLLADLPADVVGLEDGAPVDFPAEADEYAANAAAKARAAAGQLGLLALADDSGLEVAALGGAPGPHSARYGGPGLDDAARVDHLLRALGDVPAAARQARFVCVVALATPGGQVYTARGECAGRICESRRGHGGFGYDPVFELPDRPLTLAEIPADEKDRLSHRARALLALRPPLLRHLGD